MDILVGVQVNSFLFRVKVCAANISLLGKTPCAGTRMAKVELKLVAAMLLLGFEHRIVDSQGKVPDVVPGPNWNDTLIYRPAKGTCDLEYRRTSIPL